MTVAVLFMNPTLETTPVKAIGGMADAVVVRRKRRLMDDRAGAQNGVGARVRKAADRGRSGRKWPSTNSAEWFEPRERHVAFMRQ